MDDSERRHFSKELLIENQNILQIKGRHNIFRNTVPNIISTYLEQNMYHIYKLRTHRKNSSTSYL